jgi:hypothetical protein
LTDAGKPGRRLSVRPVVQDAAVAVVEALEKAGITSAPVRSSDRVIFIVRLPSTVDVLSDLLSR